MKQIVFLTPGNSVPGFRLAGMEQLTITAETAAEVLTARAHDPEFGLVVIDERLLEGIAAELLETIDRRHPGKVTTLPSPETGTEDVALEIIRKAIGYHIRMLT